MKKKHLRKTENAVVLTGKQINTLEIHTESSYFPQILWFTPKTMLCVFM